MDVKPGRRGGAPVPPPPTAPARPAPVSRSHALRSRDCKPSRPTRMASRASSFSCCRPRRLSRRRRLSRGRLAAKPAGATRKQFHRFSDVNFSQAAVKSNKPTSVSSRLPDKSRSSSLGPSGASAAAAASPKDATRAHPPARRRVRADRRDVKALKPAGPMAIAPATSRSRRVVQAAREVAPASVIYRVGGEGERKSGC